MEICLVNRSNCHVSCIIYEKQNRNKLTNPNSIDLINYFHSGSKSPKDYKIGTENEKFLFHKESLCPLQYSDGPGIVDVFKILIDHFHWSPIFDGDNVIGLSDTQNDRNISLEPGGQIELSDQNVPTYIKQMKNLDNIILKLSMFVMS